MLAHTDPFIQEIITLVSTSSPELFPEGKSTVAALLTQPPEYKLGQAALPCHSFAKRLRQPPIKIAEDLKNKIVSQLGPNSYIAKIESVQGYLNFFVQPTRYARTLFQQIQDNSFFTQPILTDSREKMPEKIIVEHSQPNTHKALHVGHLRNMFYGDAVCRQLAYVGHEVVRATYPGDFGTHIGKTLWYILKFKKSEIPWDATIPEKADWLGQIYCDADQALKDNDSPETRAEITQIIQAMHAGLRGQKSEISELYEKTREWSLSHMRKVYEWLGIEFDVWYFESECEDSSRELVLQKFKEGIFIKSEGAIGLDLSSYSLGFALLLKSDGNGLYLTKDLELIRRKFEDPKVTRSLYVVDVRQKLHFQQLFKTAEIMGYPQAAKSEHLSYETVTNKDGAPFSSRDLKGSGAIKLSELKSLVEGKIIENYLNQYRGEWSDGDIQKTAEAVALGAIKYGFLCVDSDKIIKFLIDDWIKLEGETGPYLQYVHARSASLLEKVGKPTGSIEGAELGDLEGELLFKLGRFHQAAYQAATSHRPSQIGNYLFETAKLFNRFYKEISIKTSEGATKQARLRLVDATQKIMAKGLELLGIPAPTKM